MGSPESETGQFSELRRMDAATDGDPSTWKWNIDHITPQSDLLFTEMSHDPESNFQKCWALSNIRPLSAKQNIIDGASRVRHKKKAA